MTRYDCQFALQFFPVVFFIPSLIFEVICNNNDGNIRMAIAIEVQLLPQNLKMFN